MTRGMALPALEVQTLDPKGVITPRPPFVWSAAAPPRLPSEYFPHHVQQALRAALLDIEAARVHCFDVYAALGALPPELRPASLEDCQLELRSIYEALDTGFRLTEEALQSRSNDFWEATVMGVVVREMHRFSGLTGPPAAIPPTLTQWLHDVTGRLTVWSTAIRTAHEGRPEPVDAAEP